MRVAVAFVDVSDSVGLFERAGQEAALHAIATMQRGLAEAAAALDGMVVKTMGDGVMIVFQDPERALEFGLGAVVPASAGRLALRVGMSYGPAVESQGDYFGDTVNVAARLVELARPGQFLTTQESLDAARKALSLRSRRFGRRQLKGKSDFVDVVEVLSPTEDNERTRLVTDRLENAQPIGLEIKHGGSRMWVGSGGAFTPVTVGRGESNMIVLSQDAVSREHLSITRRNNLFYVVDHSTNGILLVPDSGAPVGVSNEEVLLHGSGKILVGGVVEKPQLPEIFYRITAYRAG